MKNTPYCLHVLFLSGAIVFGSVALPISGVAREDAADASAETAGERAYFGQTYCGVSPERIGGYKAQLKKVLHDASDFDNRWQAGWRRAENEHIRMESLRRSDPVEFSARVKSSCERLKWLAKNSIRARPQK